MVTDFTWADLSIVMTSKRLIHRLIHCHFSIVRPKLKLKILKQNQEKYLNVRGKAENQYPMLVTFYPSGITALKTDQ